MTTLALLVRWHEAKLPQSPAAVVPSATAIHVSQHVHQPGQIASSCRMALSDFEILVSWTHTMSAAIRVRVGLVSVAK